MGDGELIQIGEGATSKFKTDKLYIIREMELWNLDTFQFLIENGADIHVHDDYVFRFAAKRGYFEFVQYLTELGADIYALNNCALRWACQYGRLNIVQYLVGRGADIHVLDDEPLELAIKAGHLDIVKYLTVKGSYLPHGIVYACQNNNLDILKYLIDHLKLECTTSKFLLDNHVTSAAKNNPDIADCCNKLIKIEN